MRTTGPSQVAPVGGPSQPRHGPAARWAGVLLLLTGAATAVSVAARVAAGADQPTLGESLAAISDNQAAYALGGGARLVSGIALAAAALCLQLSRPDQGNRGVGAMSALLLLSGLVTAASGAAAAALALMAPGVTEPIGAGVRALDELRWVTGKLGFTLAGLGLIAAAWSMWRGGGIKRPLSAATVLIGAAMLFIWVDAATVMHRISGIAFLVWLLLLGGMLLKGRWAGILGPGR